MELGLGNTELAFLDFQALTEMHPEDASAWVKLAELMVKSGQLEAPEALLDKAIELDPQRADARLLRGSIRFRLGRYYGASRTPGRRWPRPREAWRAGGCSSAASPARRARKRDSKWPRRPWPRRAQRPATGVAQGRGFSPGPRRTSGRRPRRPGGFARTRKPPAAISEPGRASTGPAGWRRRRKSFEEALERRDWVEAQQHGGRRRHRLPGLPLRPSSPECWPWHEAT